jgi:ribosome biogenesis GTPase
MHPLATFGWDDDWAAAYDDLAEPDDRPARICLVRRVNCDAVTTAPDTEPGEASPPDDPPLVTRKVVPSPRLSEVPDGATLPAVGDWVVLSSEEDTPQPVIVGILPRRSVISRRDPADVTGEQVLAANVDILLIVHGLDRELNLRRIERGLVLALQAGATPVVVLTKADLCDDPAAAAADAQTVALDHQVCLTSAETGEGIADVAALGVGSRTLALLGESGAGKSRLVNTLLDHEAMAVGAVREGDAKGRHTTVTRELLLLPGGGVIIDTPGLRGLGLWDADLGIDLAFPDVFDLAAGCRFADCSHGTEPGCAVRGAVEAGTLDVRRVESYRHLVGELDDLDRRRTEQEREQGERGWQSRGKRTGRRVSRRGRR